MEIHLKKNIFQQTYVLCCLMLMPLLLAAQYDKDYAPLKNPSTIPPSFIFDPVAATQKNIASNTLLTSKEASVYYKKMNFFKAQLFQSGKLYLENDLSRYVDSVTARLLLSEPNLKTKVHVYVTRFTQANAFCFPDGDLFINSGLIAILENETELAFIIAHEIAHYAEQHSIKDYKRLAEIEKKEQNIYNKNSSSFRRLMFSRESEFDADSWGLQLIAQAGYDPNIAAGALMRLKNTITDTSSVEFKKVFETEDFTLDTSWCSEKAINRHKYKFETDEDDPIRSGKLSDLFQTHPDLDKRMEAIALMAKNTKRKNNTSSPTESRFKRIKELATFERIINNFQEQDYLNSILGSINLLQKYPQNAFLNVQISKSLYWLSYYKEINEGEIPAMGDKEEHGKDFLRLYAMLNEMGLKDSKKLAYTFTVKSSESFQDSEAMLFYQAINTENYLGKNAAKNYYRDYATKYPNGQFLNHVKIKLQ